MNPIISALLDHFASLGCDVINGPDAGNTASALYYLDWRHGSETLAICAAKFTDTRLVLEPFYAVSGSKACVTLEYCDPAMEDRLNETLKKWMGSYRPLYPSKLRR